MVTREENKARVAQGEQFYAGNKYYVPSTGTYETAATITSMPVPEGTAAINPEVAQRIASGAAADVTEAVQQIESKKEFATTQQRIEKGVQDVQPGQKYFEQKIGGIVFKIPESQWTPNMKAQSEESGTLFGTRFNGTPAPQNQPNDVQLDQYGNPVGFNEMRTATPADVIEVFDRYNQNPPAFKKGDTIPAVGSVFKNANGDYYIEPLSNTAMRRGLANYNQATREQKRAAAATELVRQPFRTVAESLLFGSENAATEAAKRAYIGAQYAVETGTEQGYLAGATLQAAQSGAMISGAAVLPFMEAPALLSAPIVQNIGLLATAAYGVDVYGRGVRAAKSGDQAGILAAGLEAATVIGVPMLIGSIRSVTAKPSDEFSVQTIGRRAIRPTENGGGVELDIINVNRGGVQSRLFGQTVFVQEGDYTLGLSELIPEQGKPVSFARSFARQGKPVAGNVMYETIGGDVINVENPQTMIGGARVTTVEESFKAKVARKLLSILPETEYVQPAKLTESDISYIAATRNKLAAQDVELRLRSFDQPYLTEEFGVSLKRGERIVGYADTEKGIRYDPTTGKRFREIGIRNDVGLIPMTDELNQPITPANTLKHESLHMLRPEGDEMTILTLQRDLPNIITTDTFTPEAYVSKGGKMADMRKFLLKQATTSTDIAAAGYVQERPGSVGNDIELSFGKLITSSGQKGKFESVVSVERMPETPSITSGGTMVYKFKAPPEPPTATTALAIEQTKPGVTFGLNEKVNTLVAGQTFMRQPQQATVRGSGTVLRRPTITPATAIIRTTTQERELRPMMQTAMISAQEQRGGQRIGAQGLLMQSSEDQQLRRSSTLIEERAQQQERMTVRAVERAQKTVQQQRVIQKMQPRMQARGAFLPNIPPTVMRPPVPHALGMVLAQRSRRRQGSFIPQSRRNVPGALNPDYLTIQEEELRTGRKALSPAITRATIREYAARAASPSAPAVPYPTALGMRNIARGGHGLTGGRPPRQERSRRRGSSLI